MPSNQVATHNDPNHAFETDGSACALDGGAQQAASIYNRASRARLQV